MSKNDNINSIEKLKTYKRLAESKDKYLLYVPEMGYDMDTETSEADLFRESVDFSKVAITAFADTIELKGGNIRDMSLGLCFYPYINKEDTLLNYLYDNLDMPKKKIKQYLTHGSIYVNNVKTRQYNYPLINGMEIVIDTDNKNKKVLIDIIDEPLKYQSKKTIDNYQ